MSSYQTQLLYAGVLVALVLAVEYRKYTSAHTIPVEYLSSLEESVPKTVYLSWVSKELPPLMMNNLDYNKRLNPTYTFEMFDDTRCRDFIKDHYDARVVKAFDLLVPGAYKSDLWRYCILYKRGGVYMDIKCKCVVPLDACVALCSTVFVRDLPTINSDGTKNRNGLWNGFMISPPGNPIFKQCIDKVVENCEKRFYGKSSLDITGPCMIGGIVENVSQKYVTTVTQLELHTDMTIRGISRKSVYVHTTYPGYREEQKKNAGKKHYSEYYKERTVYAA